MIVWHITYITKNSKIITRDTNSMHPKFIIDIIITNLSSLTTETVCGWARPIFFYACYSMSRIWSLKLITTLLDHENLARKRNQKNQNPNPNLRRRLCGGARDLWLTRAAVRVCEDASAQMEVVGGAMINGRRRDGWLAEER